MEREVGGGIGMGNTCKPMAVSFQCMTKFTTNKTHTHTHTKKTKMMASGPITSWEIAAETVEAVSYIILGGSKITSLSFTGILPD